MNVSDADLTDIADRAEALRVAMYRISSHLRDDMPDLAWAGVMQIIMSDMVGLQARLDQVGAQRSGQTPQLQNIPLELLQSDTNKQLLSKLIWAHREAKKVDEERSVDAGAITQMLDVLAEHVRLEIRGPNGLD